VCVQACERGEPTPEGLNQWYIRPVGLIVFVSLCVGMCVHACERGEPTPEGLNQWYVRPAGLIEIYHCT